MQKKLSKELLRAASENHDYCQRCGYRFQAGETTHLGYGPDQVPLHLCHGCSDTLIQPILRRPYEPLPYEVPEPQSKLWRYMDFTKYVSMLSSQGLYFSRVDCFEDGFEGGKERKLDREKWDAHYLDLFRSAIRNPPVGYSCPLSKREIEQQAGKLLGMMDLCLQTKKKRTFANCWHENVHESEAMWRLYSSFIENAVAVRTTFEGLYQSLGRDPQICIGRIRYIELDKDNVDAGNAFWRKRNYFEHEREVRALITDNECHEVGQVVSCDLHRLIEELFVSPKAPGWFVDLLEDVNAKYGLRVKVNTSELIEEPFF